MESKKKKQSDSQKEFIHFLNNNFSLLTLIFVVFVFVYSYIAVIKPQYNNIVIDLQNNLDTQNKEYMIKKGRLESLEELIAFYKGTNETNIAKLERMLPSKYIKERLFVEIGHLVAQGGFTLNYVGITRESELTLEEKETLQIKGDAPVTIIESRILPTEVDKTKVTINVSGVDYYGLKYLVSVLENSLKLVDIISISFSPMDNTAVIEFWTYHLK